MVYVSAPRRREQIVPAARRVMARDGVADASLRSVATEAGVPLGTMQHAFRTKSQLLRAVVDDVIDEMAVIYGDSTHGDDGLAHAVQCNLTGFWSSLVAGHSQLQLMQYELTMHALRSAEHEELATWQYRRYCEGVARWCEDAASRAGEVCAIPFDQLARLIVAGIDGLILQHLCEPDELRSADDLQVFIDLVIASASVHRP